jgi:hypothetical protein
MYRYMHTARFSTTAEPADPRPVKRVRRSSSGETLLDGAEWASLVSAARQPVPALDLPAWMARLEPANGSGPADQPLLVPFEQDCEPARVAA